MASVLKASAHQRQGEDLGYFNKGQRFLDGWGVGLSASRTRLGEAEMSEIILSSPMHKQPGPDGIPGVVYERNARFFAGAFVEAMGELQEEDAYVPSSLGQLLWMVTPKTDGVNRIE